MLQIIFNNWCKCLLESILHVHYEKFQSKVDFNCFSFWQFLLLILNIDCVFHLHPQTLAIGALYSYLPVLPLILAVVVEDHHFNHFYYHCQILLQKYPMHFYYTFFFN